MYGSDRGSLGARPFLCDIKKVYHNEMRQDVITRETIERPLWEDIQLLIGRDLLEVLDRAAEETGVEIRLVGGAVRDLIIDRPTTDLDFVLEGDCSGRGGRVG